MRRSFLIPAAALAAVVGVVALAWFHLRGYERALRRAAEREVVAIADLQVAYLLEWRRQVVDDAGSLGELPVSRGIALQIAAGEGTPGDASLLTRSLDARLRRERLDAWLVVGARGEPVLADPRHPAATFAPDLARGAPGRPAAAIEPVPGEPGAFVVVVPVRRQDGAPAAAVLFAGRLSAALPPPVSLWPGPSRTAEAFLGVPDGGDVVLLPLRRAPGQPLPQRAPLASDLPLARALRGDEGVGLARDPRGRAVIAARRRLPGLGWAFSATVDEDEVLAPLRERAAALAVGLGALLLLTGIGAWAWWRAALAARARRQRTADDEKVRQRHDFLWAHSNDIVIIGDQDGRILDANDRAVEAYGRSREALRTTTLRGLRAPEALADLEDFLGRLWREGSARFETVHRRKDGTTFPVEGSVRLFQADGRTFVFAAFRDVSDRKALDRAGRMQASLLARLSDAVMVVDREKRITAWTGAAERIYGWRAEEVTGRALADVLGAPPPPGLFERLAAEAEARGEAHADRVHRRKDGSTVEAQVTLVPLRDGDGRTVGHLLVSRDVTERNRAAAALQVNEERLRLALEVAAVGTVDLDVTARRVLLSEGLARLLGLPEQTDFGALAALFGREEGPRLRAAFADLLAGRVERLETEHQAAGPRGPLWLRVYARVVERAQDGQARRVIATAADLTLERRLQAQLVFADRLASIGTLAAGVAHEINNPLSYLLANFEFLEGRLADCPDAREDQEGLQAMREARDGARRIAEIVRGLRTFSRQERDPSQAHAVDLRQPAQAAARIAENLMRPRARLVLDLGPAPPVAASEHELAQVALNLVMNGVQAIPEGHPEANAVRVATGKAGDGRAFLEVRDTGSGIDPDHLPRIFDPFFTTKPVGEGSGLGLAICHGIVEGLGGRIEVESAPGQGSTFRVLLPAAPETPFALAPTPAPAARRRGRVLVLDDEALVCRAVARTLAREHEVIALTDPEEALARLGGGEEVDLVLCDLTMPVLTGMDCYEALRRSRPELARSMVFLTGGAFTASAREFLERVPNRRVEKPFDAEVLRRAVAEGIAAGAAAG